MRSAIIYEPMNKRIIFILSINFSFLLVACSSGTQKKVVDEQKYPPNRYQITFDYPELSTERIDTLCLEFIEATMPSSTKNTYTVDQARPIHEGQIIRPRPKGLQKDSKFVMFTPVYTYQFIVRGTELTITINFVKYIISIDDVVMSYYYNNLPEDKARLNEFLGLDGVVWFNTVVTDDFGRFTTDLNEYILFTIVDHDE